MTTACIIAVAITGSVPRKADTGAIPVTVNLQIESIHEAFEAGASLVHIHVRDEDEAPLSDSEKFADVQLGVRKYCPGMIVQFSTGARGRELSSRGGMLRHRPDMASLAIGSVNFPTFVNENPPDFIKGLAQSMLDYDSMAECELFDMAMLYNAANLVKEKLLADLPHV